MATNDNIQHGIDDNPSGDAEKGAALGGLGGIAVGAAAGSLAGPVGAIVGAVAGGLLGAGASGAAVAAVDAIDNDNTISGVGSGATPSVNSTGTSGTGTDVHASSGAPVTGTEVGGHNVVTGDAATSEAGKSGLATGAVVGGLLGTAVGGPVGAVVGGTLGSLAGGVAGDAAEAADDVNAVNRGAASYNATTTPSVGASTPNVHSGVSTSSLGNNTPDVHAGASTLSGSASTPNVHSGVSTSSATVSTPDVHAGVSGASVAASTPNVHAGASTPSVVASTPNVHSGTTTPAIVNTPAVQTGVQSPVDHVSTGLHQNNIGQGYAADNNYSGDAFRASAGIGSSAENTSNYSTRDTESGITSIGGADLNADTAPLEGYRTVPVAGVRIGGDTPGAGNNVPGIQTGGQTTLGSDTRGIREKAADALTGDHMDDKTGGTVLNEPTTNVADSARGAAHSAGNALHNAGSSVAGAVHGVIGDVTTPGNGTPGVQTGGTTTAGADTRGITEKAADAVTGDHRDDKTGGIVR